MAETKKRKKTEYSMTLPIGTILRGGMYPYRIEEVLGQGGFDITYKVSAKITIGNIPVYLYFAIKEFFSKAFCFREKDGVMMAYSESVAEDVIDCFNDFVSEGKRLAKICKGNKNIVNVNEVFEANNTAYYVMEFIEGRNLRTLIQQHGSLSEKKALSYILPIINAVHYLHQERILHLDIKPENIMLHHNESGLPDEPVLIDFGVSLHLNDEENPSKHSCYTSRGYSPIEQYHGLTHFSPETDVYALAATLFFLLAGHDPEPAFDTRPSLIEKALPNNISERVRRAIFSGMKSQAVDRIKSVKDLEKALLCEVTVVGEDTNSTTRFKVDDNATKMRKKSLDSTNYHITDKEESTDTSIVKNRRENLLSGISVFSEFYDESIPYLHGYYQAQIYSPDWYEIHDFVLDNDPDTKVNLEGNVDKDVREELRYGFSYQTVNTLLSFYKYIERYKGLLKHSSCCVFTYHTADEYFQILKYINKYQIKKVRIIREQHLMTYFLGGYSTNKKIVRLTYKGIYCDVLPEYGCYNILHSGILEETPLKNNKEGYQMKIENIEYHNMFSLLAYCAMKLMLNASHDEAFADNLLLDIFPFPSHLYQIDNGRAHNDLGIITEEFVHIPFKRTIVLPVDCKAVMLDIAGKKIFYKHC